MPHSGKQRIVILGSGFGGLYTARHLERCAADQAEVTLVSKDNFFLMTPLLFEAGSGKLEFRDVINPVRPLVSKVRFVQAAVDRIDLTGQVVHAAAVGGDRVDLPYDHLVLALGQITNTTRIPGSEDVLTFKTVVDAVRFYSSVINAFEGAAVEEDPAKKRRELTFVVIGGGLVGVELMGELTDFVHRLLRTYRSIKANEVRLELIQQGPDILPEMGDTMAQYAAEQFRRRGVKVRVNTGAEKIEAGRVYLPGGEVIEASVVVLAAGLAPNPVVAALDLPKDKGRVKTDPCMRVESHPGVWALGDCAATPGPDGKPYPTLAQHAIREARQLATNIVAVLDGKEPKPFVYHTLGTMAAIGNGRGMARFLGIKLSGFFALLIWRGYYLFQMPLRSQRLRILVDWMIGLFFSPPAVTIDLGELRSPSVSKAVPPQSANHKPDMPAPSTSTR